MAERRRRPRDSNRPRKGRRFEDLDTDKEYVWGGTSAVDDVLPQHNAPSSVDPKPVDPPNNSFSSTAAPKSAAVRRPAPPNRFGIKPGPRWDGIDRSNGFENDLFSMRTSRANEEDDRYRNSVIDL